MRIVSVATAPHLLPVNATMMDIGGNSNASPGRDGPGVILAATPMTPDALEGWTLERIREIADAGVIENDRFDLKADLQPADRERRTVAAFANSAGGFLVFGVTDDRRVEGVANAELVRDFGSKLRDGLSPSVDFRFANQPHVLPTGRLVYVAHIPRSTRGPHAVSVNGAWTFLKRTAAGSNEPMTYEEIRDAFTDLRRRQRELAWLKAEVGKLRALAEKMGPHSPAATQISRLSTRFDLGQLKAIRLSIFDDLGRDAVLIDCLDALEESCARVNEILGPLTAFAVLPRDRSYSGSGIDGIQHAVAEADHIVVAARGVLARLHALSIQ
jgi:hypothetical protein